jgi:hypothetical protein
VKKQTSILIGILMAFCMVLALNPVSAVKVPGTLDSYIFDGPADDGIYYAINAQLTTKDTIFITLDCYSDAGVLGYSGTTTIEKIDADILRISDSWGPPYNSYFQQDVTSKMDVKQYYFKEWKPNLFR